MKKVIQRLLGNHDTITTATAAGVMALVILLALPLAGCQKATDSTPDSVKGVTADSPFNTLANTAEWGDESDFLRIVDMDSGQTMVNAKDFPGDVATLSDERTYAFVIYSHNTSDATQAELTLTLSYPDTIIAGEKNEVNVLLSWGGDNPGVIGDTLQLDVQTDIAIYPVDDNGNCALLTDFYGNQATTRPDSSFQMDGVTTHILSIGDMDADYTVVTFFVFETIPAL